LCFHISTTCPTDIQPYKPTPRSKGGKKWQINEAAKTVESIQIEEKVVHHHTVVLNKGLSSTGEVTKTGGIRSKSWHLSKQRFVERRGS
jgi:hypothetical protein